MTKGERIKYARERLGMSQVALADKIHVSKQTLYKYESGIITNIPSTIIEMIATATHTTPSFIMGWESIDGEPEIYTNRYYVNKDAAEVAQMIFEKPELRILLDAASDVKADDLKLLVDMALRLKGTNEDG